MTPELRELIEDSREDLLADQPSNMGWTYIRDPASQDASADDYPASLRELWQVADGLLAGAFDLPPADELPPLQSCIEAAPEFTPIVSDPDGWIVFALLHDEPLFLNASIGSVWLFPWTGDEWYMRDEFVEIAPDLDSFMRYYVFGPGYGEIGSTDDEWYGFLRRRGFLENAAATHGSAEKA